MTLREEIESLVRRVLEQESPALGHLKFEVYKPREKTHGDFATNVAIVAAKALGTQALPLARTLAAALKQAGAVIESAEVAGPGFINVLVSRAALAGKLGAIIGCRDDEGYGAADLGQGRLVQVEFVSANPTGPLNVVSARAAAVGDALVRLLRRIGHDAKSEFYVNDAGGQVNLLGRSLEARFREALGERAEIPEGGYPGEYLVGIASEVAALAGWADRQDEGAARLSEPGPAEEPALVDEFIARETSDAGPDASEVKLYLSEYLDLKESLGPSRFHAWPSRYACWLSEKSLSLLDLKSRLAWVERYRSFLAARRPPSGAAPAQDRRPAAAAFLGEGGRESFNFGKFAVERIVEAQRTSLERFGRRVEGGLRFDAWVRESSLKPLISDVSERLVSDARFVCEEDGAVWLKAPEGSEAGAAGKAGKTGKTGEEAAEKDQWVIKRRTGEPTYFLADISYHVDKRRRGFERVIDIWGPDHHGHVGRMKQAMSVVSQVMPDLEMPDDWLEIIIAQQVNLMREGKRVQMSKRAGEYVTLDDLVSEVGPDAARFFFLMRRSNSHLDFDLELAKKTSEENPVYYVQYAHARICSIIEFARENGLDAGTGAVDMSLLATAEETDLAKCLTDFDDVVRSSALALEPHRLVGYLMDVAGRFHRFYHNHRVVTEDRALSQARLSLCLATRTVLRSALSLVGVSAPSTM